MIRTFLVVALILVGSIGCSNRQEKQSQNSANELSRSIDDAAFREPDVPTILANLKHKDWKKRRDAAKQFPFRAPIEYRPAIPDLIKALDSEHDSLRLAATMALISLADRKDSDNLRLPELSDAIEPLNTIIQSNAPEFTRRSATIAIADIGMNLGADGIKQVVPMLSRFTSDSSGDVSVMAMDGLSEMGEAAQDSIPAVLKQLTSTDRRAAVAAGTLVDLKCDPTRCVPQLIAAVPNVSDNYFKSRIIDSLARFGSHSKESVPILIPLLKSKNLKLKQAVAFALGQIGPASEEAIPLLAREFKNASAESVEKDIRIATLAALISINEKGKARALELVDGVTEFSVYGTGWLMADPDPLLSVLCQSPTIKRLELQSSKLEDDQLVHLASMKKLEELTLPGLMTDKGLKHIAGLSNLRLIQQRLPTEYHHRNRITDVGLESLGRLSKLETLSLSYSDLSNQGLVSLKSFPKLRKLSIGSDRITDEGVVHLAVLRNLTELSVASTNVGDEGVETIVKNHPTLTKLNLCSTEITAKATSHLAKLKKLRWLGVYNTPLNGKYPSKSRATMELEKLLPNCEVMWID